MKSKYGPGGEFEPEWKPPVTASGGPPADPPAPPPEAPELPATKPGWRAVPKKGRKKKEAAPQMAGPSAPPPPPTGPELRRQVQSWATWQRTFS